MKLRFILIGILSTATVGCINAFTSMNGGNGTVVNSSNLGAGGGLSVAGFGAMTVPTGNGVIVRVQNGLENNVSAASGNFKKVLAQVQPNLPKVTDPTKATGFDQVQLMVYGACSDLTTGTTPKMQSVYNVNPNNPIATNQAALVAAGVRMMNQYTAGLASNSAATPAVNSALNNLVTTLEGDSTNTSKIAFMSVCIAANTAGSTLMGF